MHRQVDESAIKISAIEAEDPPEDKKQILWAIIERCRKDLSEEQKKTFYHLLIAYNDVFTISQQNVGRTKVLKHSISVGNAPAVRQAAPHISVYRIEEVQKLLKGMLHDDIIQPTKPLLASPNVLVRKKDGSIRMCIDYRKINAVTRKDAYPLLLIDDTLDTLSGSKWFIT